MTTNFCMFFKFEGDYKPTSIPKKKFEISFEKKIKNSKKKFFFLYKGWEGIFQKLIFMLFILSDSE